MREEILLSAMGHIAGDLILEAKEASMKKKASISRPARMVLIAAIIAGLLAITAGAAYLITEWDQIFADRFKPTEEIQTEMAGNIDEPTASVTQDGATLSVRQTITDGNELYAIVELQLPEDFDMEKLRVDSQGMSEETLSLFATKDTATGNWYTGPATMYAEYFQGTLPEEELESLTVAKVEENIPYYIFQVGMGGGSFIPKHVDIQTKTISYLLMTSYDGEKGGPMTIWFENIYCNETAEPVLSGPIYVSWTPEYDTVSLGPELQKEGQTVGTVSLTPMSIQVDVPNLLEVMENPPEEGTAEYDQLVERVLHEAGYFENLVQVTIHCSDGNNRVITKGFGGGYDDTTGELSLTLDTGFGSDFLDLDTVTSVTVGTIHAKLN